MLRSITKVLRELDTDGIRQRSGRPFDKVVLHKILKNRTYIGLTVHKKEAYPGKHEAIIAEDLWTEAQAIFREPPRKRARAAAARDVALLRGLIFGPDGRAMTPQHARKEGRCYHYYVSMLTIKRGENDGPIRRVPAGPVDQAVIEQIRRLVRAPEIVARTIQSADHMPARFARRWPTSTASGTSCSQPSRPAWCASSSARRRERRRHPGPPRDRGSQDVVRELRASPPWIRLHDRLDHPGPGQLRRCLRVDLLQALRRPNDRGA
jgi:hypothetical protein